jgi:beta-lactamase regulating signal transducer with metallopeptidase domain
MTAIYMGLHIVAVLFFLLAVLGIVADIYLSTLPGYGFLLLSNFLLTIFCELLLVVWIIGAVHRLYKYFKNYWQLCWHVFPVLEHADLPRQQTLKQIKESMGIRAPRLIFYESYKLPEAFVTGIFRPRICIPHFSYEDTDLTHILTHELTHYRCRDHWFREIAAFAACIHWFNPLAHDMVHALERWDEFHCDSCVCEYYDKAAYGKTLASMYKEILDLRKSYIASTSITVGFVETFNNHSTYERILRIMTREENIKQKRSILVSLAAVFTLALTGTALAVEPAADTINRSLYLATAEIGNETNLNETSDDTEYVVQLDEATLEYIRSLTPSEDNGISLYAASSATISCSMKNNIWRSGTFRATSGQAITVTVSITPSDVTVKAGIIDPDGAFRYAEGHDGITHTFSLTKTGTYQVVVFNETTTTITAIGSYITYTPN